MTLLTRVVLGLTAFDRESEAFTLEYIVHKRLRHSCLNHAVDEKARGNLIGLPLVISLFAFLWHLRVQQVPHKVFVLAEVGFQVDTELARIDGLFHRDPEAIEVVKLLGHQVDALETTEHVVD